MAEVLIPLAVIGLIVFLGVLVFQRGRAGVDFSPRGLLALYLFIARLAGILVLIIGLSGLLTYVFASAFGSEFAYGGPVEIPPAPVRPCPPGAECPEPEDIAEQERLRLERQAQEDLLRGIIFTVLGTIFWGAHRVFQGTLAPSGERATPFYGIYLMVATVIFGLATILLLPQGLYEALARLVLDPVRGAYQTAAGERLASGLVVLPFWLVYLRAAVAELRSADT